MVISSYQDLVVWQKSLRLAEDIYKITKELPRDERFGITSQIRRSVVSIPSNIAEGHERLNRKEFRQFLGISRGSAAELQTQLILIKNIYNLDVSSCLIELEEVHKMLNKLIARLSLTPKT